MPGRDSALIPPPHCLPSSSSLPLPPGRWQDLREECIKLKKRVFDLEQQNQMLSALFQQKLQLTTGSLPQVGTTSLLPSSYRICLPPPRPSPITTLFFPPNT